VEYEKPPGTRRILFLGDSVTLGFGLDYDESFVPLVGRALNARRVKDVEVINAGVDGYSQWQQNEYLKTEGLRFQPDVVVVSFVLNDATERFMLDRFGAPESSVSKGFQIALTRQRNGLSQSGILFSLFARRSLQPLLLGQSVAPPVSLQALSVDHLVQHPDHPLVKEAWERTLADLGELFETCQRHSLPVVLVVFPFTFQTQAKAWQEPQRLLREFAAARRVAALDLLPILESEAARRQVALQEFFIDWDHPSPLGSPIIAEHIADLVQREVAHSW
jgi:lysophospholipase L1-like esterase